MADQAAQAAAYSQTIDPHDPHPSRSFAIFIALCVCTLLSVVFDVVPMNRVLVAVLVLAVAVAKAQFVMRYFMHLKFEGRWKYVLLLPTAILAVGLPLALAPDIAMHYYTQERPGTYAFDMTDEVEADEVEGEQEQPAFDEQGNVPAHELTPPEERETGGDQ
jgi:cytochrome c oxidase subunit IV